MDETHEEKKMPNSNRITHSELYEKFDSMSAQEKESLIRRTARIVFDEEFNRETTQEAILKSAEIVVNKINLREVIRETAKETAIQVSQETASKVISEAFRMLDIDPSSREETRAFRDDIRFMRNIRKVFGDTWTKAVGIVLLAIMLAAIYGAWSHFVKGPPSPSLGQPPAANTTPHNTGGSKP